MILIDALFINKGGGAVLLEYLIETILTHPRKNDFFFLLDPRFAIPSALTANYTVIPNKISERIKFYKAHKQDYTCVFCFANTPPPVKLKVPAYTYLHNQKLLEAPKHKFKRMFWGQYIKYLFIKLYNRNTDYYIVQTPHIVQAILDLKLKDCAHCLTLPFYNNAKYLTGGLPYEQRPADEFVFISNPSPQKNYPTLLNAWEYLLNKGLTPRLHVTIDDTAPQYIARVHELNGRGARIVNHVQVKASDLYFNYRYLIFPSIMESFGLPLVEATDSGMKVLASDLPYVYDVIRPSAIFDPYDCISIANAVIKALDEPLPFPSVIAKNEIRQLISLLTGE